MLLWMAACSAFGPGGDLGDGRRQGVLLTGDTGPAADTAAEGNPLVGSWVVAAAWCVEQELERPVGWPVEISEDGADLLVEVVPTDPEECESTLHLEPVDGGVWRGWASACGEIFDVGLVETTLGDEGLHIDPSAWWVGGECGNPGMVRPTPLLLSRQP